MPIEATTTRASHRAATSCAPRSTSPRRSRSALVVLRRGDRVGKLVPGAPPPKHDGQRANSALTRGAAAVDGDALVVTAIDASGSPPVSLNTSVCPPDLS